MTDIERIVGSKTVNGSQLYLIKWSGFDDSENTWEYFTELQHTCPTNILDDIISNYTNDQESQEDKIGKIIKSEPGLPLPAPAQPAKPHQYQKYTAPTPSSIKETEKVNCTACGQAATNPLCCFVCSTSYDPSCAQHICKESFQKYLTSPKTWKCILCQEDNLCFHCKNYIEEDVKSSVLCTRCHRFFHDFCAFTQDCCLPCSKLTSDITILEMVPSQGNISLEQSTFLVTVNEEDIYVIGSWLFQFFPQQLEAFLRKKFSLPPSSPFSFHSSQRILRERKKGASADYLVYWQDRNYSDCVWVDAALLPAFLIETYKRKCDILHIDSFSKPTNPSNKQQQDFLRFQKLGCFLLEPCIADRTESISNVLSSYLSPPTYPILLITNTTSSANAWNEQLSSLLPFRQIVLYSDLPSCQKIIKTFELNLYSKQAASLDILIVRFDQLERDRSLFTAVMWHTIVFDLRDDVRAEFTKEAPTCKHKLVLMKQSYFSLHSSCGSDLYRSLHSFMNFDMTSPRPNALLARVLFPKQVSVGLHDGFIIVKSPMNRQQQQQYAEELTRYHQLILHHTTIDWEPLSCEIQKKLHSISNFVPASLERSGKLAALCLLLSHFRNQRVLLLFQQVPVDKMSINLLTDMVGSIFTYFDSFLTETAPVSSFVIKMRLAVHKILLLPICALPQQLDILEMKLDAVILFDSILPTALTQIWATFSALPPFSIFQLVTCNSIEEIALQYTNRGQYFLMETQESEQLGHFAGADYNSLLERQITNIASVRRKVMQQKSPKFVNRLKPFADPIVYLGDSWNLFCSPNTLMEEDGKELTSRKQMVDVFLSILYNPKHMNILVHHKNSRIDLSIGTASDTLQQQQYQPPISQSFDFF